VINRKVLMGSGKTFPLSDTYAALLNDWINKK